MKRLAILLLLLAACGSELASGQPDAATDSSGSGSIDAAIDSAGMFALTSSVLSEGAAIDAGNTCDDANISPPLVWSGDAKSPAAFAVVLTDKSNNNLVHWVIYDVPATATGLPANVPKAYAPTNVAGAHQTASYQTTTTGYLGPCPPVNGGAHSYEFAVYGVDVTTLPGTSMTTSRAAAVTLITEHMTAKATLTGMYMR